MRQRLYLLFLLLSLTASQMHEYYLSVARLEYDEKAEDFEMSVWFFADDISLCLSERSGLEIDWQEKQIALADSLLNDYLSERLYLIDGQDRMRPMELMGTKQDGELIHAFLRLHAPEATARAFRSSRLSGGGTHAFGGLSSDTGFDVILERACPM